MNPTFVEVQACAKINLRLAILARETSGYHSLETLFCGISLSDTVQISSGASGIALHVEGGIDTGAPERNLVTRAAERFYRSTGLAPALRIRLVKRIPAAAGLGGGSSDAAATLRGLNELHRYPLSRSKLLQLGADLGSDVPFFLTATPFALAWSRGERLLELDPLPPQAVVVAHPGVALPTPAAFGRLAELRDGEWYSAPFALPHAALLSWEAIAHHALNDLEAVAFERIPQLTRALRALLDHGARFALLAGSGASIFGIFERTSDAENARRTLDLLGLTTWLAHTLDSWPSPGSRIDPNAPNK